MSWPPASRPLRTRGSRLARAAYRAAVNPAGPEPITITFRTSMLPSAIREPSSHTPERRKGRDPSRGQMRAWANESTEHVSADARRAAGGAAAGSGQRPVPEIRRRLDGGEAGGRFAARRRGREVTSARSARGQMRVDPGAGVRVQGAVEEVGELLVGMAHASASD